MSPDRSPNRAARANRTASTVVAGLGLLVLVVFGIAWPSVRAGGFTVSGPVVVGSLLVPAVLLVLLGIRGKRGA
jgi:hypothetical protein